MTAIIKFTRDYYPIREEYHTYDTQAESIECVPLAEHKALEAHTRLLATEVHELRGLLRRVVEMPLIDDCYDSDTQSFNKLEQLLLDCEESLR